MILLNQTSIHPRALALTSLSIRVSNGSILPMASLPGLKQAMLGRTVIDHDLTAICRRDLT